MVNGKVSKNREDEIYLMLVSLDKLLKENLQDLPLVSLYGPFDGQKNIIFPVSNLLIKGTKSKNFNFRIKPTFYFLHTQSRNFSKLIILSENFSPFAHP